MQPNTSAPPSLEWKENHVPVSTRFDDPYFSLHDGLAETNYVFLQGNNLPARFKPGFHIAELGFGTGLNFCLSLHIWRSSGQEGKLHFTSFEAYPLRPNDMARALAAFPQIAREAEDLLSNQLPDAELCLIEGDARRTVPQWQGKADAWFLDGFSPAKNPQLWQADLMRAVAHHTKPAGTVATYTAAGFVRRGLEDAGFAVERAPGFAHKRHMTKGTLRRLAANTHQNN